MQVSQLGNPAGKAHESAPSSESSGLSFVRRPAEQRLTTILADNVAIEIDLNAAALIVVDMQNDFCHPDGWFAQRGVEIAKVAAVVPAIDALVEGAHAGGLPVIWLNWGVRADRANLPLLFVDKSRRTAAPTYGDASPSGKGRILVQGEWGADLVPPLAAAKGDITVHKHRLSGFFDNELDSILRLRGITTLFFAGINIDRCVFSTLQDAGFLGYDCILIDDCCATVSPDYVRDAILFLVRQLHGVVTTRADLFTALGLPEPASQSTPDIRSAS